MTARDPRELFALPAETTYLDNAATMPKALACIDAMDTFHRYENASVHRGTYAASRRATERYEEARATVARYIGSHDEHEIVFTHGATEALNMLSFCLADRVRPESSIVVSGLEHHANLLPWRRLACMRDAELRTIPVDASGAIDTEAIDGAIDAVCAIVAVSAMSNVTGYQPDLTRIVARAHEAGALVIIDAAQAVAHMRIDVRAIGCDALVFSAHKIGGPFGIGALWCRRDLLDAFPPFLLGGGIVEEVSADGERYLEAPWRFEAGTPAISEAIGFAAAIDAWDSIDLDAAFTCERSRAARFRTGIARLHTIHALGTDTTSPVVPLLSDRLSPYDMSTLLSHPGVCVRAGKHCAEPYVRALNAEGVCRASLSICTSDDDVDRALACLERIDAVGSAP